jgi:hypothetical protein
MVAEARSAEQHPLPEALVLDEIEDRAATLATSLDGLRCWDAIAIVEKARDYLLRASRVEGRQIPSGFEGRLMFGHPTDAALLRWRSLQQDRQAPDDR